VAIHMGMGSTNSESNDATFLRGKKIFTLKLSDMATQDTCVLFDSFCCKS